MFSYIIVRGLCPRLSVGNEAVVVMFLRTSRRLFHQRDRQRRATNVHRTLVPVDQIAVAFPVGHRRRARRLVELPRTYSAVRTRVVGIPNESRRTDGRTDGDEIGGVIICRAPPPTRRVRSQIIIIGRLINAENTKQIRNNSCTIFIYTRRPGRSSYGRRVSGRRDYFYLYVINITKSDK